MYVYTYIYLHIIYININMYHCILETCVYDSWYSWIAHATDFRCPALKFEARTL